MTIVTETIAPLLLFIVLFVGFGLMRRHQQDSGACAGCTGCADKTKCKNEK